MAIGTTPEHAFDIDALREADLARSKTDPYGASDFFGEGSELMGRAADRQGGAMGGVNPRLGALSQGATMAQWEQAPLTHGLFGFNRPSHWLDWRMRQQDEITRQHYANINEREGVLSRLWQDNPYAAITNQSLARLGNISGQWEDVIGAGKSQMARGGANRMDETVAAAAARGIKLSPTEIAMAEANQEAGQAAAVAGMREKQIGAEQTAMTAAGEIAGRAGQLGQMRDATLAQYALGTLPEAVSLELMGASPEKVINDAWRRQFVGMPYHQQMAIHGRGGNVVRHGTASYPNNYDLSGFDPSRGTTALQGYNESNFGSGHLQQYNFPNGGADFFDQLYT